MKIEVVKIGRMNTGKLRAFIDVMFGGEYIVKGFKVIETEDNNGELGLFVGMPQQAGKNGKWYNTFDTADDGAKQRLNEVILDSYME